MRRFFYFTSFILLARFWFCWSTLCMSSTVKRVILSRDSAIVFDTKTVILVSELNVEPFVSLERARVIPGARRAWLTDRKEGGPTLLNTLSMGPRAVCIMSASGAVSTETLHQDASSSSVVTYEINSPHTPASREEDADASNKEWVWVHILAADHRETLGRIRCFTDAFVDGTRRRRAIRALAA